MAEEELVPGLSYREFVAETFRHATERQFRSSAFFGRWGADLLALLTTPRVEPAPGPAVPPGSSRLRFVHWNIEKGKALPGLVHHLTTDPFLRSADLVTINEADIGTARSGNVDTVRELASALGCASVFLPSYVECTKGLDDDLLAPGENTRGLHGLTILSRLPVLDVRMTALPHCWDYFHFHEKRFGFRQGLYVKLDWNGRPLIVATTHLEVRRTPACRARQFAPFLEFLDGLRAEWGRGLPVVLAGDWNTNSFRRGAVPHSVAELLRILSTREERLAEELVRPARYEPVFALLERHGYAFEPFNDRTPTASQDLGTVEDLRMIPRGLAEALVRRMRLAGRVLRMRLDWIAAAGLEPAGEPVTLPGLTWEGGRASDHAPIGVDLRPAPDRSGP